MGGFSTRIAYLNGIHKGHEALHLVKGVGIIIDAHPGQCER